MRRLVRLGPLVFRDPLLLCGALYLLLWFDASGFLRIGLCAAILHEMGHISLILGSPDIQKLTRSKRKRGCGSGRQDSHRDGLPLPATDTSPRRDKLFGISEIHLRRSCRNTRYHI